MESFSHEASSTSKENGTTSYGKEHVSSLPICQAVTMEVQKEVCDLLIVVDATASMTEYLASLQKSLPQIISVSALTDCFSRIGVLAYRDYSTRELLKWSGWYTVSAVSEETQVDLIAMAKSLVPMGNASDDEACKTGLAGAYELAREDATTIILLYTDAPPHTVHRKHETTWMNKQLY